MLVMTEYLEYLHISIMCLLYRIQEVNSQYDTRCSMEDLLRAMDDRDEWWERVRQIRTSGFP